MLVRANYRYTNGPRQLHYAEGQEFEVTDEEFAFLNADAPGAFSVVTQKGPSGPPENKAILEPKGIKVPLSVINGISPARQEMLRQKGIVTFEDLAGADAEELARLKGISQRIAQRWINEAKRRVR